MDIINDNRDKSEFKNITFSGFKKSDVIEKLYHAIISNDLKQMNYWYVELHISGSINDLWKIIILVASKNINIDNPYLFTYLYQKYKIYFEKYDFSLRNDNEIRNILNEIMNVLINSKKNNKFITLPKISDIDFKKDYLHNKITYNYQNDYDDEELNIGIGQILWNIDNDIKKIDDLIYWYQWIEKLEQLKKKKKYDFIVKKRNVKNIDEKYKSDWTWIIWEIIFVKLNKVSLYNKNIKNEIISIYYFYKLDYKSSDKKIKKYLLFCAFLFLKNMVDWNTQLHIPRIGNISHLYANKMAEYKYPEIKQKSRNIDIFIETKKDNINEEIIEKKYKKKEIKYESESEKESEPEETYYQKKLDLLDSIIITKKD